MIHSMFFYKQLTKAEVGQAGTHEIYIRLSNGFDYETFFGDTPQVNEHGTIAINFEALNTSNESDGTVVVPMRFAYYRNSNREKRIPSLGELFQDNNVEEGDIVSLESRRVNGKYSFYIKFFKKGTIYIDPSSFSFTTLVEDKKNVILNDKKYCSLQQIFYGAPGTGKSHAIKEITKGGEVVRTTFHPDSDYSTFVGAYKPTIEKGKCRILDKQDLIRELLEFKKQGSNYPLHSFATEYWESFKKLSSQDINEVLSTCQFNASYADEVNKCTAIGERLLAGKSDTKIVYSFVPQAFLNAYVQAWESYPNPIYLVIEEINRGNCAQIFGDLFQLLDRNTAGFSEYPIITDNDMSRYLKDMFVQKGHFTQDAERCADIDNQYSNEYESVTEGVKSGELLLLPNNLHILATMNTSDQSLFPIDSAFKRRWDWKYIKISNGYEKGDDGEYLKDAEGHKIPLGWEIDIKDKDGNNYDWWLFLQKINSIINYMTASADKQLGYFFCKAIDKKISADVFVNKVLFYLWNDVFKDYAIDEGSLFTYKKDGSEDPIDITFPNFYDEDGNVDTSTVGEFIENVMAWSNEDVK